MTFSINRLRTFTLMAFVAVMAWPLFAFVPQHGTADRFGYDLSACGHAQADGLGNWTTCTNAEGHVYTMTYDALSCPTSATNALGQQVFRNFYDPVGNLTNRLDGSGNAITYSYDVMDRVASATTTVNNHTFATQWKRDLGGLVTNLVYAPDKTVSRTYDPDGRLASVSDWLGHTWTFAWDGAGKPTGSIAPDGILYEYL